MTRGWGYPTIDVRPIDRELVAEAERAMPPARRSPVGHGEQPQGDWDQIGYNALIAENSA